MKLSKWYFDIAWHLAVTYNGVLSSLLGQFCSSSQFAIHTIRDETPRMIREPHDITVCHVFVARGMVGKEKQLAILSIGKY